MTKRLIAALLAAGALFATGEARAAATDCTGTAVDGIVSLSDSVGCVEFRLEEGIFDVNAWFHAGAPDTTQLASEAFIVDADGERFYMGDLDFLGMEEFPEDNALLFAFEHVALDDGGAFDFALSIGLIFSLVSLEVDGVGLSILNEVVTLALDGRSVPVSLFTYTDFDLGGTPDDDAAFLFDPEVYAQADVGLAAIGLIGDLSELLPDGGFATPPDDFEVRECGSDFTFGCELFVGILDGSITDLDGVVDVTGDLTHAMRHDIDLAEGSAEIAFQKAIAVLAVEVPEPMTLGLVGLGLAGLGWARRRAR